MYFLVLTPSAWSFVRETGVTVSDLFELDSQDRVIRLLACYGQQG